MADDGDGRFGLVASTRALWCHAGLLLLIHVLRRSKLESLGCLVSRVLVVGKRFIRELRGSLGVLRTRIGARRVSTVCRLLEQNLLLKLLLLGSLRRNIEAGLVVVVKLQLLVLGDKYLAWALLLLRENLLLLVRRWVRGRLVCNLVV